MPTPTRIIILALAPTQIQTITQILMLTQITQRTVAQTITQIPMLIQILIQVLTQIPTRIQITII